MPRCLPHPLPPSHTLLCPETPVPLLPPSGVPVPRAQALHHTRGAVLQGPVQAGGLYRWAGGLGGCVKWWEGLGGGAQLSIL
jgi:hypothetical protein